MPESSATEESAGRKLGIEYQILESVGQAVTVMNGRMEAVEKSLDHLARTEDEQTKVLAGVRDYMKREAEAKERIVIVEEERRQEEKNEKKRREEREEAERLESKNRALAFANYLKDGWAYMWTNPVFSVPLTALFIVLCQWVAGLFGYNLMDFIPSNSRSSPVEISAPVTTDE